MTATIEEVDTYEEVREARPCEAWDCPNVAAWTAWYHCNPESRVIAFSICQWHLDRMFSNGARLHCTACINRRHKSDDVTYLGHARI